MNWRGKPNPAPIRLAVALTTALMLTAACTEQAERTPAENNAASPNTAPSVSSTTVLQGTMTTKGPQAETNSTATTPEDTPDLAFFAQSVGAKTVVATVERTLFILKDGVQSSRPIELGWAWSDGLFVYESSAEGGKTFRSTASLMSGEVVCDTWLPLHHATQRSDETYVMAVTEHETDTENNWDEESVYSIPTFAVDCETGDSQPIASFLTYGIGEVEVGFVERIAGREFNGVYNAEGNADMLNEQGISLNGDDYAGYHTFSSDGSLVAYGDFTGSPSPHHTKMVKLRDTSSGALLWESELHMAFARLHFSGESLVVELFDPADDGVTPGSSALVLDLLTGNEIASITFNFNLLYVGD